LDTFVFTDIDAAIAQAKAKGVQIVFVLFDFGLLFWANTVNGVQTGGRTDWLTDLTKRTALMNNVVIPTIQRYANEPTVFIIIFIFYFYLSVYFCLFISFIFISLFFLFLSFSCYFY
jgi:hypothetical protein